MKKKEKPSDNDLSLKNRHETLSVPTFLTEQHKQKGHTDAVNGLT